MLLVIPIIVSLFISLIPAIWYMDIDLNNAKISKNLIENPVENIILLTVDKLDDEMFRKNIEGSIFGSNNQHWRKIHSDVLNKIINLNNQPQVVGYDIQFYNRITEYDNYLIDSFRNAKDRDCSIILGASSKLNATHWIYNLYEDKTIEIAGVSANVVNNRFIKSYNLSSQIEIFNDKEDRNFINIPSIGFLSYFRAFSKKSDYKDLLKRFPDRTQIKFVKNSFNTYHYRDILIENNFDKIKENFSGKIVLIGIEDNRDIAYFPHIPDKQSYIENNLSYGVYYHANAVNYMFYRENIEEIKGIEKLILLILILTVINTIMIFIRKIKIIIRIFTVILINLIVLFIFYSIPTLIPLYSVIFSMIINTALIFIPEIILFFKVLKLKKLTKEYAYMNKGIFKSRYHLFYNPLKNLLELSNFINTLNQIYVENEGHTFFEEIDYKVLDRIGILEKDYQLSKKRPDCIARADYIKEDFIGTRIRRVRNYLFHSTLAEHIQNLAVDSVYYYTKKDNLFKLNCLSLYLIQYGIINELTEYLINI